MSERACWAPAEPDSAQIANADAVSRTLCISLPRERAVSRFECGRICLATLTWRTHHTKAPGLLQHMRFDALDRPYRGNWIVPVPWPAWSCVPWPIRTPASLNRDRAIPPHTGSRRWLQSYRGLL